MLGWSCGGLAVVVVVGLLGRLRVGGGHGSSLVVPLVRCSLYRSQSGIYHVGVMDETRVGVYWCIVAAAVLPFEVCIEMGK